MIRCLELSAKFIFMGLVLFNLMSCKDDHKKKETLIQQRETRHLVNDLIQFELEEDSIAMFEKSIDIRYDGCYLNLLKTDKNLKSLFQVGDEVVVDTSYWYKESFRFSKVISQKFVLDLNNNGDHWDRLYNAGYKGFYNFSKPLFSKDYSHAFMKFHFVCGSRCGQGVTAHFKKVHGKWKIIKQFCYFVN